MLANSRGQDLENHLVAVSKIGKTMAKILGLSSDLIKDIEICGLLHDIGKATSYYQDYIKKCIDGTIIEDDEIHEGALHHETGWAFLTQKINRDIHNNILSGVYWHHAKPLDEKYNTKDDDQTILCGVDIAPIENIFNRLIEKYSIIFTPACVSAPIETPDFFYGDGSGDSSDNAKILSVRGCVISADRHVSGLNPKEVEDIASGLIDCATIVQALIKGSIGPYKTPKNYDINRFKTQESCAVETKNCDKSTVEVRATAGYGKTIIGLLWGSLQGGKNIWVCPRNEVARSVYKSILKEIEALGISCTVELYLTGKREACNFDTGPLIVDENTPSEFKSDIVVTNIDNLLAPMVNNRVSERLFYVMGGNVIFDEFHEFVNDSPLFAAFITLMRVRNRLSNNSRTLLLSATPTNMHTLWDSSTSKTEMLPDAQSHYPAAHNLPYNIRLGSLPVTNPSSGSLTAMSSVRNAQDTFKVFKKDYLAHGKYTEEDKKIIMETISSKFGPKGTGVEEEKTTVSALILQAAMDISFKDLNKSILSPESDLQTIGRCDRWGTLRNGSVPTIYLMDLSTDPIYGAGEKAVARTVYSNPLRDLWIKFLTKNLSGITSVTLDELYTLYNAFYTQNGPAVSVFHKDMYKAGLKDLKDFEPTKSTIKKTTDKKAKTGAKSLRSPDGSYYFTVEKSDKTWLGPDEVLSENRKDLFARYSGKNSGAHISKLVKTRTMEIIIKKLITAGYEEYQTILNKNRIPKDLESWLKLAKNPETPLPDVSRVYNTRGGKTQNKIGLGLREK